MASFQAFDQRSSTESVRPPHVSVRGTHIFVERGSYSHHGIDRGDGTVVDFSGGGGDGGKRAGLIRVVTIEDFARGDAIHVRRYGRCDEPDVVIRRAESKLGESGYHLFNSNCEHFATWCMTGSHESAQVQAAGSLAASAIAVQLGPRIAQGTVANLGSAAPASAANTMSGLKAVGGSAAAGVGVLAAGGALVGAGAVSMALKERPYLTAEERDARRVGRVVGAGGGALAAAGVFTAVGVLGAPGYGAAGISSGLAALGKAGGGGMVAGVAVAVTVPMLAALILGILGAFLAQWWSEQRGIPKFSF